MLNTRIRSGLGRLGHKLQAAIEKAGSLVPAMPYISDGEAGSTWWLMSQAERDPELAAFLRQEGVLPPLSHDPDELRGIAS